MHLNFDDLSGSKSHMWKQILKYLLIFFLSVGMNYVFDVQHTFREVYDSTKRKMFMSQQSLDDQGQGHSESEMDTTCENQDVSSSCEVMMQIKF